MAEKKSYWELLRDPRWQRKRLEILNRADFTCEECGSTDKTLNVHHKRYRKGAMPWEYENDELRCLCEGCHRYEHQSHDALILAADLLGLEYIDQVIGYIEALYVQQHSDIPADWNFGSITSAERATGVAHALGLTEYESQYCLCRANITKGEIDKLAEAAKIRAKANPILKVPL
jgi:hypothetical protein